MEPNWDYLREIDDRKYRDSYNYDGRYDEEDQASDADKEEEYDDMD